jgi:ABC-type amino acid transport substrate-binding protein
MKISKIIIIIFSCLVFSYIFKWIASSTPTPKDKSILIVGTSPDYPLYEFIDVKTGEIIGFDIDVVTEIAKRLGKKLKIKDMPFSALIFGLLTNDVDLIASGMSPTKRRARVVSFTKKYLHGAPLVILTKKSHFQPKSVQDLIGKTVAVNLGYVADMHMSTVPGVNLIKLDSPAKCFMALDSGSIDAFVCAQSPVKTFLHNNSQADQFATQEIDGTGEDCAFAVNKQNTELLNELNTALESMKNDGTLDSFKQKWEF